MLLNLQEHIYVGYNVYLAYVLQPLTPSMNI